MKFTLDFRSDGFGKKTIDEPFGLADINFTLKQKENGLGRDISFSGGEIQFEFTHLRNHELKQLLYYHRKFGFESIVVLTIEIDELNKYTCDLDFATAETDDLEYFKYTQNTEPYLGEKENSGKFSYINNIPTILKRGVEKYFEEDYSKAFVKKLNNKKIGAYNQGRAESPVESSIIASFYNPFVKTLDKNKEYFGITKDNQFVIDKGNNPNIVKGSELNNVFDLATIETNEKGFPIFKDKTGTPFKVNGINFIVKNQDNQDIFLYRNEKYKTIPILQSYLEKNKNVKLYQIDNGSYQKGLFTKNNQPPTVEELDEYDRYNPSGGGYGIFEKKQLGGKSQAPVLAEKGEVFKTPDGDIQQIASHAPSHDDGEQINQTKDFCH